ncbi:hypothetical protein P775_02255 [Puniceibacterium antarcticum]|uniref:PRC-barrel domain-containing protein n=2 Tax=Puniceibacterium antarcticum TaxID=1206336 RepID=A0A2G8RJV1_9RHOB|nr:hypothetical protein P775_02255 [Puniceibacterium antarcticum]
MMLGSAIAALVAGGAIAQTADTTPPTASTSDEAPAVEMDNSTTMESDTQMGTDGTTAPDAGATMAPESDTATDGTTDGMMDTETTPTSIAEMTVDEVVGTDVVGIDDESVGEVDYVVQQTDGLAFVVGVGGFLGLGEYTVAIPADQFSLNADGDFSLSSMTKEDIKTLPEFTEDGVEGLDGDLVIGDLNAS